MPQLCEHTDLLASRNQLVCCGKNLYIVVLARVSDSKNNYLGMTRVLNLIQVKGHQWLTNLNMLILLNKGGKAVTLHLNRINAYVNQNLFARIGSNTKGVNSWSSCGNSARNCKKIIGWCAKEATRAALLE